MEAHYSMKNESSIGWYLDSEPDEQETKNTSTKTIHACQPWRSYWPPRCRRVREVWLRSEFPEVLSWRFDRAQPFDRPWRAWTSSARAMEEQPAMLKRRQPMERLAGRLIPKNPGPLQPVPTQGVTVPQLSNHDIDNFIIDINLQSVISDEFSFLVPLDLYRTEKPYLSRLPCGTNLARANIVTESHATRLFDVSGHESFFTLAESGFQFAKSPIRIQQWTDSSVCSEYIPKLERWLIQHFDCSGVFIYAYNLCSHSLEFRGKNPADTGKNKSTKTPFLRAHCDATANSCFKRLQLYFPDKAHTMMKDRVRFLNVWRPISTPVQDCPLALCDFRTVRPEDLVPADIIFPHYQDEAYEVLHNPNHRWFYKKGMEWDDVLLFKLGDNSPDEAPLCPHSAFMDSSVPKGTPGRVSIEVRAIIIG